MATLKEKLEALKKEAQQQIQDQSIPLEERWQMLIQNPELGETSWRTDFGLDRDDNFLYDGPLCMEKFETMSVDAILEELKEDEDFELTPEEEITFKMYCVDNMYSKMKFDW
jgi:hypothetical protein